MAQMNMNEIRNTARMMTIAELMPIFEKVEAVKFADAGFAILQNVDGQEVWTSVTIQAKNWKPTKVAPAFDPYVVAQEWQEEKAMKDAERAAKLKEKEKKA